MFVFVVFHHPRLSIKGRFGGFERDCHRAGERVYLIPNRGYLMKFGVVKNTDPFLLGIKLLFSALVKRIESPALELRKRSYLPLDFKVTAIIK